MSLSMCAVARVAQTTRAMHEKVKAPCPKARQWVRGAVLVSQSQQRLCCFPSLGNVQKASGCRPSGAKHGYLLMNVCLCQVCPCDPLHLVATCFSGVTSVMMPEESPSVCSPFCPVGLSAGCSLGLFAGWLVG